MNFNLESVLGNENVQLAGKGLLAGALVGSLIYGVRRHLQTRAVRKGTAQFLTNAGFDSKAAGAAVTAALKKYKVKTYDELPVGVRDALVHEFLTNATTASTVAAAPAAV